ncbi:hypothetical protein TTHERM_00754690 (macronuclear) [Tetrahymena thermophila SB210]|uniref:Uncharacterized protein n=1 Tax=Tetrahymena thermophila (strain SB210) TaxID=312017 RepID=Q23NF4_TETTS|nr:hypothetical protein TTHERM_00754690 [Tetrahymena thermophila SB210]EAR98120.2 hypothetical protein TTHERM_00754690 [Tetrahymena thermophila SB210]|eukprot:XP_001018365.2 hypothetical protein TTHERM_00754690 [Tetrahymena thermophila SB210]
MEVLDHNYELYGFNKCDIQEHHDCSHQFPDHTSFFNLDVSQKSHLIKTIEIQLNGVYNFYRPYYTGSFPKIQINSPYSNIIIDYTKNIELNIDLSLIKIISCKKITFKIFKIENIIKSFETDLEIFDQQIKIIIYQQCNFQDYQKLNNLILEKTSKEPLKIVDIYIHDNFSNWIPQKYDNIERIITKEQQFYDIIKDSQSLDQFFAKKAFLIFKDEELNIGIHTILQILVLQKFENILKALDLHIFQDNLNSELPQACSFFEYQIFKRQYIKWVSDWPSNSPDQNPIENI